MRVMNLVLLLAILLPIIIGKLDRPKTIQLFRNLTRKLNDKIDNLGTSKKQYGILYIPPKGRLNSMTPFLTPATTSIPQPQPKSFPYPFFNFTDATLNYLIVTPQYYQKQVYHTEAILLNNTVVDRMIQRLGLMNTKDVEVYLYSYYFPCEVCAGIISKFAKRSQNILLNVGFSSNKYFSTRRAKVINNIIGGRLLCIQKSTWPEDQLDGCKPVSVRQQLEQQHLQEQNWYNHPIITTLSAAFSDMVNSLFWFW